jgi:hypothetical protein
MGAGSSAGATWAGHAARGLRNGTGERRTHRNGNLGNCGIEEVRDPRVQAPSRPMARGAVSQDGRGGSARSLPPAKRQCGALLARRLDVVPGGIVTGVDTDARFAGGSGRERRAAPVARAGRPRLRFACGRVTFRSRWSGAMSSAALWSWLMLAVNGPGSSIAGGRRMRARAAIAVAGLLPSGGRRGDRAP